jgi:hypothetical protein
MLRPQSTFEAGHNPARTTNTALLGHYAARWEGNSVGHAGHREARALGGLSKDVQPATVVGDIYTPRIAIEDGEFLEGSVWVHKDTPRPRTKKDHSGVAGGVR